MISKQFRKIVVIFFLLLILLLEGCSVLRVESEAIVLPKSGDASWQLGYQKDYGIGKGYIREWILKGEHINSWSELLSIQFIEGVKESPFDFVRTIVAKKNKQCPGTIWSEIKRDENTIYYKFEFPDCLGQSAHIEITRMFRGNDGLHRLSYAQKIRAINEEKQKSWLLEFSRAYIAKGSPKNRLY